MKPATKLIVWGCLPKINPEALTNIYDGPLVVSTDTGFLKEMSVTTTPLFDSLDISGADNMLVSSVVGLNKKNDADHLTSMIIVMKQPFDFIVYRISRSGMERREGGNAYTR